MDAAQCAALDPRQRRFEEAPDRSQLLLLLDGRAARPGRNARAGAGGADGPRRTVSRRVRRSHRSQAAGGARDGDGIHAAAGTQARGGRDVHADVSRGRFGTGVGVRERQQPAAGALDSTL